MCLSCTGRDLDPDSVVGLCYQGSISVASRHPVWVVKRTTTGFHSGKTPNPQHTPAAPRKQTALKHPLSFHYTLPFLKLSSGGLVTKHHTNEENCKHVASFAEVHAKYVLVIAHFNNYAEFGV